MTTIVRKPIPIPANAVFKTLYCKKHGKVELDYLTFSRLPDSFAPYILHRTDGPALISNNGDITWYYEGSIHRIGGPAVTIGKSEHYYIEDVPYSKEEYNKLLRVIEQMPLALRLTDPRWWVREIV